MEQQLYFLTRRSVAEKRVCTVGFCQLVYHALGSARLIYHSPGEGDPPFDEADRLEAV